MYKNTLLCILVSKRRLLTVREIEIQRVKEKERKKEGQRGREEEREIVRITFRFR